MAAYTNGQQPTERDCFSGVPAAWDKCSTAWNIYSTAWNDLKTLPSRCFGKEIMGNDDKFNYQEFLLDKRPEVERWSKEMWRQSRIDLKISLVIIVEESE